MKKKRKSKSMVPETEVHYCTMARYFASSKVLGLSGPDRMVEIEVDAKNQVVGLSWLCRPRKHGIITSK